MSIKGLLEAMDERIIQEAEKKDTFKQEELTPVIINPPTGEPQELPAQTGGQQIDVEIINTGKPPKGQPQPGEPGGPPEPGESQKGKTDKPGEGKPEKKRTTFDSHDILNRSSPGEAKEMAEQILEKADATRKERGEDPEKQAGTGEGSYMDKLRDLHQPKINWARELKRKLTEFKSRSSSAINRYSKKQAEKYKEGEGVQKSKAYHQWLKDPRSHAPGGKIIFKGPYVKAPVGEVILIVALDTSGSIPASTISKVFGEMDKIAKTFQRGISHAGVSLEGKVYFMMWDTRVASVSEYKPGDWKQYKEKGKKAVVGGGGTIPSSIFEYLKEHTLFDEKTPTAALINVLKKPTPTGMSKDDIVVPVKGGAEDPSAVVSPFIVIATDGYINQINAEDLGMLYKDNKQNILWLVIDGTTEYCWPENIIEYETVRV